MNTSKFLDDCGDNGSSYLRSSHEQISERTQDISLVLSEQSMDISTKSSWIEQV